MIDKSDMMNDFIVAEFDKHVKKKGRKLWQRLLMEFHNFISDVQVNCRAVFEE